MHDAQPMLPRFYVIIYKGPSLHCIVSTPFCFRMVKVRSGGKWAFRICDLRACSSTTNQIGWLRHPSFSTYHTTPFPPKASFSYFPSLLSSLPTTHTHLTSLPQNNNFHPLRKTETTNKQEQWLQDSSTWLWMTLPNPVLPTTGAPLAGVVVFAVLVVPVALALAPDGIAPTALTALLPTV